MPTIDSNEIIRELITNHGYYMDDPRVYQIVEYTNRWGKTTWGVTYITHDESVKHQYEQISDFVRAPKIIWNVDRDGK